MNNARLLLTTASIATGWAILWGPDWRWNPLMFFMMWTGAAVAMWSLSNYSYPGARRHIILALISVPLWWWFELVNSRVQNWHYVHDFAYSRTEFALLSSIAFSTVVPALVAAFALVSSKTGWLLSPDHGTELEHTGLPVSHRFAMAEIMAGVLLQAGVFAFPAQMYPMVWVAPFLVVDGSLGLMGGPSLLYRMSQGRWKEPVLIAMAGLLCGILWEFWNFNANPKWVYHVPLLGFGKVFEMPVLGYGGYIPFAWSVIQLVRLVDHLHGVRAELAPPSKAPAAPDLM